VRVTFRDARPSDIPALVALHNATAEHLTARFGKGHWSHGATERGMAFSMRTARTRVGVAGRKPITVLRLAKKKPWAIDVTYFTPVEVPLYLTGMAVAVEHQRAGLGRIAMFDAESIAREWPADAIRLDAYDGAAGAGGFYAKCGYEPRGRVVYKGNPLLYFELVLDADAIRA
jgi:GNAT superfamily N-acetyltransferase